jgi:hypothetical protein
MASSRRQQRGCRPPSNVEPPQSTVMHGNNISSERFLTFATHSGFGNQIQALLVAVFVASLSNRTLIVPPIIQHSASLPLGPFAQRSCQKRASAWSGDEGNGVDCRKLRYMALSERKLHSLCIGVPRWNPDRWDDVYSMERFPTQQRACEHGTLCHTVHADLHVGTRELNANCSRTLSCEDMLGLVSQQHVPLVCLGVLNDWFFRAKIEGENGTVLRACAQEHLLARELEELGLPLAAGMERALRELVSDRGPCRCLFVRLPDRYETPANLKRLLRDGKRRLVGFIRSARAGEVFEIVSKCQPAAECEAAVRNVTRSLHLRAAGAITKTASYRADTLGDWDMWTSSQHEHAVRGLGSRIGVSRSNAGIMVDQYRCARCQNIYPIDLQAESESISTRTQTSVAATSLPPREATSSSRCSELLLAADRAAAPTSPRE